LRQEETALTAELFDAEQRIRSVDREHLIIVDRDGTVVYEAAGGADSVQFPRPVARGRIVLHNHPNGSSFSRKDVQELFLSRALEFRLVTPAHRHWMRVPSSASLRPAQRRIAEVYFEEMEALREEMTRAGPTFDTAIVDREHLHRVWTRIAAEFGWNYGREEVMP